jgi:hypothetical protein
VARQLVVEPEGAGPLLFSSFGRRPGEVARQLVVEPEGAGEPVHSRDLLMTSEIERRDRRGPGQIGREVGQESV